MAPELVERLNADVPQEGPRHPREGDLHQVEPGGVRGGVHVLEAAGAPGQVAHRLPRGVGGVVVEHDADDAALGIVRVEALEQRDELSAAVAPLDVRDDLPAAQVQRGEDRQGAVADVLVVAPHRGVPPRHRGQVRRAQAVVSGITCQGLLGGEWPAAFGRMSVAVFPSILNSLSGHSEPLGSARSRSRIRRPERSGGQRIRLRERAEAPPCRPETSCRRQPEPVAELDREFAPRLRPVGRRPLPPRLDVPQLPRRGAAREVPPAPHRAPERAVEALDLVRRVHRLPHVRRERQERGHALPVRAPRLHDRRILPAPRV